MFDSQGVQSCLALGPPHTLRAPAFDRTTSKKQKKTVTKHKKHRQKQKQLPKKTDKLTKKKSKKNKTKKNAPRRGAQQSMGRAPPKSCPNTWVYFDFSYGWFQRGGHGPPKLLEQPRIRELPMWGFVNVVLNKKADFHHYVLSQKDSPQGPKRGRHPKPQGFRIRDHKT